MSQSILREVMRANAQLIQQRMRRDERMRIEAPVPPLATEITGLDEPSFRHNEIQQLYECDLALPADTIRGFLALPRETLLADLIQVLDDAIARTPDFMAWELDDEETCAPLHALHFLAKIPGVEALDVLLRFLSLHPEALDTRLVSFLVCNAIDLRATELRPCIREAWENHLIEEFITGDLDSIITDLSAPPDSAPKTLSIIEQYRGYHQPAAPAAIPGLFGGDSEDAPEPDYGHVSSDVGRNDPCPCGGGKKYKKCCIG